MLIRWRTKSNEKGLRTLVWLLDQHKDNRSPIASLKSVLITALFHETWAASKAYPD